MNQQLKSSSPLRTYIAQNQLQPGDRLPPERELALNMGIARTMLRRMLGEMEANGELLRHVGRGTYIADPAEAQAGAMPGNRKEAPTYPGEILEVRLIVEPQIAALAAHRATPAEIEKMQHAIARSRSAKSFAEFEEWDATFHRIVVAAARNNLLASIYGQIDAVRAGPIWGRLKENTLTRESMKTYTDEHESLMLAIMDRDATRAEAEMRKHIHDVRTNLIGG